MRSVKECLIIVTIIVYLQIYHTLLKIYRPNKPPGLYFEILLPLFGRMTGLSKFSWSLSVCWLLALCCPENGSSGMKITILNLLEVCSVLIFYNLSVKTQWVSTAELMIQKGGICRLQLSPLLGSFEQSAHQNDDQIVWFGMQTSGPNAQAHPWFRRNSFKMLHNSNKNSAVVTSDTF